MKIPKDGPVDTTPSVATEVPAANDDAIDGGGKPSGWDPFEVWRTRVRDARLRGSDDSDEPPRP